MTQGHHPSLSVYERALDEAVRCVERINNRHLLSLADMNNMSAFVHVVGCASCVNGIVEAKAEYRRIMSEAS